MSILVFLGVFTAQKHQPQVGLGVFWSLIKPKNTLQLKLSVG
jgi:hypothetical protein